jgi:hypothetical protein
LKGKSAVGGDAGTRGFLRSIMKRHDRDDGSDKDLYVFRFSTVIEACSDDLAIDAAIQSAKGEVS